MSYDPEDIDEIAVERACKGDLSITLNTAETREAFRVLTQRGTSGRKIAELLGVTPRTVWRWRNGAQQPQRRRAGGWYGGMAA